MTEFLVGFAFGAAFGLSLAAIIVLLAIRAELASIQQRIEWIQGSLGGDRHD